MDRAEFDKFADAYYALHAANIAMTGESPEYFADYKVKDLWRVASTSCAKPPRILDFGAGTGTSVRSFKRYFSDAALTCLDVSAKSLEVGTKRFSGQANFVSFEGEKIPFEDAYFDIAFAACVFHHIPHWEHVGIMRELRRVLAPGGSIFIFEHNPYNPLTVRAVNTCPFDENAKLITAGSLGNSLKSAGFSKICICYRVFFPRALKWLRPLETYLTWLPLGAQYFALARK